MFEQRLIGLAFAVWILVCAGCGGGADQALIKEADELVKQGLDAWKANKQARSLQLLAPPVSFSDQDWSAGVVLVDYQPMQSFVGEDHLPRCGYKLSLQKKGKPAVREVVYIVNTKSRVITRDPYS